MTGFNHFSSAFIGMSWVTPLGSARRIEIGSASTASSSMAISIGPVYPPSKGTNGGAPMAICRDLAPIRRARSKRVSFGGPILISKFGIDGAVAFFGVLGGANSEPQGPHAPLVVL